MPSLPDDTIAAVITPAGVGGVSVLRISGEAARPVAAVIVQGPEICTCAANSIHFAKIVDGESNVVDDVLISVFGAPHSYTGEDVVEISCHGNPIIVQHILELLLKNGARLAEPGEFTKRAFLNEKIDLTQAEAVADLISASSSAAVSVANRQLHGELRSTIQGIIDILVHIIGLLELELDFVEEGIILADPEEIANKLAEISDSVKQLITTYEHGKLFAHGVHIAIVGEPNVGKSSLLNRIAGFERAIVSPLSGTTRDAINISIQHNGIRLEFWDTAGIRETNEPIEQMGIDRSRAQVEKADVVLFVIDGTNTGNLDLQNEFFRRPIVDKTIFVLNKSDLPGFVDLNYALKSRETFHIVSARTGVGVAGMLDVILARTFPDYRAPENVVTITNARHFECLKRAELALERAAGSLDSSEELISIDLRRALEALGEITGLVTSDGILASIFANFCIGK